MTGKLAASGDVTSLTNRIGGDAIFNDALCYRSMFADCTSLTVAPKLPTITLTDGCYCEMFQGCTSLTATPELPATTMTQQCYYEMFQGCTSLTTISKLPATKLASLCYTRMFTDCTSLKISTQKVDNYIREWRIPSVENIPMPTGWNNNMFSGTGGEFKENPAADSIYYIYEESNPLTFTAEADNSSVTLNYLYGLNMMYKLGGADWASYTKGVTIQLDKNDTVSFKGNRIFTDENLHFTMEGKLAASGDVTSLTNGIGGDADLESRCYICMFKDCASLTAAPELPATTLAEECYQRMFSNCTSLTAAPELPATTLAKNCYADMFNFCTSLTEAPALPATTLADGCYQRMFIQTKLKISNEKTSDYGIEWRIPTTGTITETPDSWSTDMLWGTEGLFKGSPELNTTYYIYGDPTPPAVSGIQNGKTYCKTAEFTVTDVDLDTVTVNGNTLTSSNGTYTLTVSGQNIVVATDKAGHRTTITVTINANHIYDNVCDTTCNVCSKTRTVTHSYMTAWSSDGTNHWHECSLCGEKKELSTHTPAEDDNDCTTAISCSVCGFVTTDAKSHDFSGAYDGHDATHHWHICNREGCNGIDAKVTHSGGTADYFHKAVCTACGQEYGNKAPDVTAPTNLKIQYNNNGFKSFLKTITFGNFFKETVDVTASATDDESGIASYQYIASDTLITDFTNAAWQNSLSLTPNSKKIVYVKATDNAGNETISNNEGIVVYSDSAVSPVTTTFDKNVANQANVDFAMTLNGNTFKDIKNGTKVLTSGNDYTVSGTTVTVKKAYLAAQKNGDVTLTFAFYPMGVENNENLSTTTATVTVSDTTHYHSMLHTAANAPSCTADGNTEYWYCSGCQKYFSDENGNMGITLADTVLSALDHDFTTYTYNNDATYEKDGTETATCNKDNCSETDTRTAVGTKLIDATTPTGEIKISNSSFKNFVSSITFGLFFKDSQTVTITGADVGSGLDKIYYYKSETALSLDEVKALSADQWTEGSTFTLSPNWKGIVYAKIADKSGNLLYISSDGLVLDATSPVITGVTDGGKYCNTATVLVTEENPDSIKLNGEAITLTDGKFTVSSKDGAQTIVVTDKTGNVTSATITVYAEHVWNEGKVTTEPTLTKKGVKTYTCTVCGETKTEEIPMLAQSISIIVDKNGTYQQGDKNGITFKTNVKPTDLVSIFVDGKAIDKANYTIAEGGKIVTLTADYLATISNGRHTLTIHSTTGTVSTEFTIVAEAAVDSEKPGVSTKPIDTKSAQTGDTGNMVLWRMLLLASGGALITLGITKKRKKANN